MTSPPHVAFANHKGGQGKTGLAQAHAIAAAEAGQRVLAIDMDAQGNLTRRLRAAIPEDVEQRAGASLASVLQRPAKGEIERILVPCGYGGIYSERIMVAPAHLELELLSLTAGQPRSERRLLTSMAGVVEDFDLVFIDCPPNLLSHQIDNALVASDVVFIPVEPEYDAVEAARRVRQRIINDRDVLNPELRVAGYLINRYRSGLSLHTKRLGEVVAIDGPEAVCPIKLPELVVFKNMGENATPLKECGPQGKDMADLVNMQYKWLRERITTAMGMELVS